MKVFIKEDFHLASAPAIRRMGGCVMQRGIGPWTDIAKRHSAKAVIETNQGDASPPEYLIDWIHRQNPY